MPLPQAKLLEEIVDLGRLRAVLVELDGGAARLDLEPNRLDPEEEHDQQNEKRDEPRQEHPHEQDVEDSRCDRAFDLRGGAPPGEQAPNQLRIAASAATNTAVPQPAVDP